MGGHYGQFDATGSLICNASAPVPSRNKPVPCPPSSTRLLMGELLTVRILVDRSITEVFVQRGRLAWVQSSFDKLTMPHDGGLFNASEVSVHFYSNDATTAVEVKNVSAFGMGCGWRVDVPPAPRQS